MGKRNFPEMAKTFLHEQVKPLYKPANGQAPKMRVGFFYGCATDLAYPDVGLKFIDFLTKQGVEVVVPESQNCCGVAVYTSGDLETGRMLADKNIKAFEDVDYVVTGCGTCSSTLKDYHKYLPDNEGSRGRGTRPSRRRSRIPRNSSIDVLKVNPAELKLKKEFEGKTATWHDPCHLVRYQNIKEQPRAILKGLKGLTYVEMPNADMCCGMGGTFSVYHYDISKKIADKKMEGIKETNADIVVTACPGLHDQPYGQHGAPPDARRRSTTGWTLWSKDPVPLRAGSGQGMQLPVQWCRRGAGNPRILRPWPSGRNERSEVGGRL